MAVSSRYVARSTSFRAIGSTRSRAFNHVSHAGRRFASNTSQSAAAGTSNATLRGVLAGAGVSLAALLISYRMGWITIAGEYNATSESKPRYGSHQEVQRAVADLRALFPANAISTDPDALKTYGSSPNSYHPESPHSVVVHAKSTEDVVKVVNVARQYRIPVVAYSGATSLEGHFSGVSSVWSCARLCPSFNVLLGVSW